MLLIDFNFIILLQNKIVQVNLYYLKPLIGLITSPCKTHCIRALTLVSIFIIKQVNNKLKEKIMKKVLGLDLGIASIGWALINCDDENQPNRIIDLGFKN